MCLRVSQYFIYIQQTVLNHNENVLRVKEQFGSLILAHYGRRG